MSEVPLYTKTDSSPSESRKTTSTPPQLTPRRLGPDSSWLVPFLALLFSRDYGGVAIIVVGIGVPRS